MPHNNTISILQHLIHAYPDRNLDEDTLLVYLDELADIPVPLLERVAHQHIQTSPWFPRISDLRHAAQQFAGTSQFASSPTPGVDFLDLEAYKLEDDYFKLGEFDIKKWDKLARQLENVARPYRAAELRQKACHIQERIVAEEKGEEYPPAEVRKRYAQWHTHP